MNSRHLLTTAVLGIGAVVYSLGVFAHGKNSESHIDKTHDVRGFDKIDLDGIYEFEINVGSDFAVLTSGHEKEVADMKIYVDGDTLHLENKSKGKKSEMSDQSSIVITISMPALSSMEIGGVGAGEVTGVDSKSLELDINGVAELTLSGRCTNLELDISGVGELDASGLKCENAEVDMVGVGEVDLYASKSVDVDSAGVGEVNVYGDPEEVRRKKSLFTQINIKK